MNEHYSHFVGVYNLSTRREVPGNDNVVWTADLWLSFRMFSECRLRYLRLDPLGLTPEGRRFRHILIRMSLENILFTWEEINKQHLPPV
jgi:hypothetical protein